MNLLSLVIVVAISIASIALVLSIGLPVVDLSISNARFDEGIRTMKTLDNYIKEVSSEGEGSERIS